MIHRHLKKLVIEGRILKTGTAPKVYYKTLNRKGLSKEESTKQIAELKNELDKHSKKIANNCIQYSFNSIEDHWLKVQPNGHIDRGLPSFVKWCEQRNYTVAEFAVKYLETLENLKKFKSKNFINATNKFNETYEVKVLEKVFYLDFAAIEIFGRTKLSELILHAKFSQEKTLVNEIYHIVESPIKNLIKKWDINTVGFIPHSIPRKLSLMPKIEEMLQLPTPKVPLIKVGEIRVAQKSLKKTQDRITNARDTIFIEPGFELHKPYERCLLIDDAVGSGATLQETAKKILDKNIAKKVYGLALVGSVKGFEVISEI